MKSEKTKEELQNKIDELESKIADFEKSESNSSAWLYNSPVCTKVVDLDFNLQFMSNVGIQALQIDDVSAYYGKPYPFSFFPEEYQIAMNKNLRRAKETGETILQTGKILDIKGNALWFDATISPVRDKQGKVDHIIVVSVDASWRKDAEENLLKSEKKYRDLVSLAQEGIWVIDKHNATSFVNPSMAEMLGYTIDEMLGKPLFYFMDEKGVKIANEELERRQAGIKDQHDFEFICKDGKRIITSLETAPIIDELGNYDGAIAGVMDITERKHAEEALLVNQKRYEEAQSIGRVGHWEYDPVSSNFWASDEARRMYGFNLESKDFTTEKVESCILERERVHQALIDLIESDKKYDLVFDILTEDKGIRKTIHSIAKIERDALGNPLKISGVVSDITKQKQAEEALRQSEATIKNKLKAITEPEGDIDSLELSDIIDVEMLQSVMEDYYSITGMSGAILDLSGNELVAVGWQDICTKFHRCNPETLKNCIESDTILVQDVPYGTCKVHHCKNNMWDVVTPLNVGGKHMGNIFMGQYLLDSEVPNVELFRKQANKYGFNEKEYLAALERVPRFSEEMVNKGMQFYAKLAELISSLSYSTVQQSRLLAEQKITQKALKENRAQLEFAQQNAGAGFWDWDMLTNKLTWTPELFTLFGFDSETSEASFDIWDKSMHPDDKAMAYEKLDASIKEQKQLNNEYRVVHPDGKIVWINAIGDTNYDTNGIPIRNAGMCLDITERKQAEAKIRSVEKNLKNTFDLSPSIIARADMQVGRFTQVNKAITKILGYTADEFTSKPYMEFVHPDDRQSTIDIATEQLKGNEVTFFENRYLCKDGSYKWMAWHGTKPDKNGVVTTIGSDINEKKLTEQEFIQKKQFYENIIEGVQDGIWVTDKNDVIYYANSAMEEIAGVPRKQIQGRNILKDFSENATGEFNQFYKQAKTEKKPVWYLIKITKSGNKNTWENGWLIPQYKDDEFNGIICTIRDVTKRKQAESSVRRLSSAVEQSPSVIVITDTAGIIEYVNPAFTQITGYSGAETIGQKPNILKSGEQDAAFYKEMWDTVFAGKVWRGQFHNKKKNGELFWEAASVSAILNEKGELVHYIKIGEDISEQKRHEAKLRQSTQILEASQTITKVGGWEFDIETNALFWTAENYRVHDTSPQEFCPTIDAGLNYFLPKSRSILANALKEAQKMGKGYDLVLEALTAKGRQIDVRTTCEVTFIDGKPAKLTGIFQDITESKRAEKELINAKEKAEENQKLYKDLVQSSQNLIWKCDSEGRFTFLNAAWEDTHGYKVEEMLGRPFSDFQRPEIFERDVIEFTKHLAGGFVKGYETSHITKDGTEIPLVFNALPLFDIFGEVIGTQGTAFDISKRKKAELELIAAKEKAEESDRLKSAFLANMSHEIRTPMNGVLGFLDLLLEPNLSQEEINDYSSIINKSSNRLLITINDIIDISKIEAGEIIVTKNEISINNIVEELYTFHSAEAKQKGLTLYTKPFLPTEQSTIISDGNKLHGILTNLVKNAIKYTDSGSITFGYNLKGEFIEFYVEDTGIGIPENRLDAIFNRFEQADIEDVRAFEGSGLGLAITSAYVDMLGGNIFVESEEGKGSKFIFTIPYLKKELAAVKQSIKTVETGSARIKDLNLLVVEDDIISTELLKTILTGSFRSIIFAKDGIEAVEACKNNDDLDLVLMDIKMPRLDGYDATRQIRAFNKDLVIIAQTAFSMPDDKKKAIDAGCNDYISKPINKKMLFEKIEKQMC